MKKQKYMPIGLLLALIAMGPLALAQHSFEFYNDGANVYITGTPNKTAIQNGLYVWGDVHMDGGNIQTDGFIEVQGNWHNESNTSTQSGTGLVWFNNQDINSTEDQQIISNNGSNLLGGAAFYDVDLENRGGNSLVYISGGDVEVENTLEFVSTENNRIRTAPTGGTDGEAYAHYLYMSSSNPAAIVNPGAYGALTQYVEGRLRHQMISGTGSQTYDYPVGILPAGANGVAGGNRVATVVLLSGNGALEGSFTRNVNGSFATAAAMRTECNQFVDCVADHGWWNLDGKSGNFIRYNLTLNPRYEASRCNASTGDYVIVKKPHGTPFTSYYLDGDACVSSPTFPQVTRTGFNAFSDFAIARLNAPFPIELLDITATPVVDHIRIDWTTSQETNSSHFELERSLDGVALQKITDQDAAGNSTSPRMYKHNDHEVAREITYYYRLKMVDLDGSIDYSKTVEAILPLESKVVLGVYPSPGNGQITISLMAPGQENWKLFAYNALGQEVLMRELAVSTGLNEIKYDFSFLSDGTYMLAIKDGKRVHTHKLVIDR